MSNEIWEMAGRGKALRGMHAIGNAWIFPSEGAGPRKFCQNGESDISQSHTAGGQSPVIPCGVIPAHGCRSCRERDAASSRHGRTRHATRARHNRQTHVRAHTSHTHTGPVALSGGTELAIIMLAVCTRILHRRPLRIVRKAAEIARSLKSVLPAACALTATGLRGRRQFRSQTPHHRATLRSQGWARHA